MNQNEVALAVELAAKVFGPNYYEAKQHFSHARKIEKVDPGDVLILVDRKNIVGTLFIIKKQLYLFDKTLGVCGITNVCIHPKHQTAGLGKMLVESACDQLLKQEEIMAILFARRAADGFYEKFGFLGTGLFAEMTVEAQGNECQATQNFEFRPGLSEQWQTYEDLYSQTYRKIPFSFARDNGWWKMAADQLKYKIEPWQFINVYGGAELLGYFIFNNNAVIEAACSSECVQNFCQALIDFMAGRGYAELTLKLQKNHPCCNRLQTLNHTITARRAWNGGHMTRIINNDKFLSLLKDRLLQKYESMTEIQLMNEIVVPIDQMRHTKDANHERAKKLLFDIVATTSPVLSEISSLFQHCWSAIDEF